MSEWTEKTIGDLCSKVIDYRGKTPPKVSSGIKLITSRVIKDGRIKIDADHEFIPSELYDSVMRRGIPELGDVLITTEAPLGEIAMIISTERIAIAQRVILLRANKEIVLPKFLYLSLKAPIGQGRIHAKATGTTVLGIKNPELKNVVLPIPPLPIQQKIAAILSAYDDLIENNLKQIKLLEEMAQITYEEWFVRFKFPNHENTPVDEVTGLPLGWERKKLGDILILNYGKSLTSNVRSNGSVPVYGSAGIVGFHSESLVKSPGLIVGRKGNVGSVFWSDYDFYPIDTVFFVSSNLPLPYVRFLLLYTKFLNSDSAIPGLNRNAAYLIKVITPEINLIQQFSDFVSPLFEIIKNLQNQNQLLKEARDILLPRLMTGKISVDNL